MITWPEELVGKEESYPDTTPEPRRTPQCAHCARFCRILSESYGYDGNGTQFYVTFSCSKCGIYTEGLW